MNYFLHISVLLEIYILLALGANQIVGYSGMLSLAQAVFYGMGAYAMGIISTKLGLSFWATMPFVIVILILFSFITGYISGKVRDLYFGLATLAVQVIFSSVIYNWVGATNGPFGIAGIKSPELLGFSFNTPGSFSIFGAVLVMFATLFLLWFQRTPVSRLIQATRDDQIAVLGIGKNPNYYKNISIGISAVITGLAGSLYATYASFIDPSSFTLDESILILSIVLIGGHGKIIGPISGAAIYVLLPELLKLLDLSDAIAANMRMILFGILLVFIVVYRPRGIFGKNMIQRT